MAKKLTPVELQHGDAWMSSLAFFDRLDRALFRQEQLPSLRRYQENLDLEESFD
ncbi:hypothetical protein SEA_APIARY_80 [Rhodococcus phage Apiary]|nr:hypothetical protein SEA_BRAXOADDIE_80 [Rhodococcus phage Braxoaddie]WNM65003.1 hypothetical protein SEA_MASELOP_80 [Rhodococcus phage Maselop]WNM67464.1 hypothetical protein SEA_POLYYUKI_80 [Rhodococcus phage Polyyuki]WNM69888.1 hypothetical protein SEA_APIARY_80 [Rhodococcus phage Apiary]